MAATGCTHRQVTTYVFVDGNDPAGLWACADCGHKFAPVNLPMEKDAERYRKLRAAIAALGEPVSATLEQADEPGDWSPVAWITHAGRLRLQDGDGPVKAMPHMDDMGDFIMPLYDRHTVAELARTARVLALERVLMSNKQCRNDGRCQHAIDAMVEDLGHCPLGACSMPASTPSTERFALADKYRALMFGLRDSDPGCTVAACCGA